MWSITRGALSNVYDRSPTPTGRKTMSKKPVQNTNVDTQCPYCKGERKHSASPARRKACKEQGSIKPTAVAK